MAPEEPQHVVVLDLDYDQHDKKRLVATRYTAAAGKEFLVKWYPLAKAPTGFTAIAGGVVYVPKGVTVTTDHGVGIDCTPRSCTYKQRTDMLVLLLPAKTTLSWYHNPTRAKEHRGRIAVYWLSKKRGGTIEVVWSLTPTRDDAGRLAEKMNAFLEDQSGKRPTISIDDYEHYDVALSYASEDRAPAETIAAALKSKGKHVFYDYDYRAKLWGRKLHETLHDIYCKRTTFCLLLVSQHYKRKRWTRAELRAAMDGAAHTRRGDYILPVQLDATRLDELPEDLDYVPIEQGVDGICNQIVEKLKRA